MQLWSQALWSWIGLSSLAAFDDLLQVQVLAADVPEFVKARPRPQPRPQKKKRRKKSRKGNEGASGQRCTICQAVVHESQKAWKRERDGKTGSPYHYIGQDTSGSSPEERMMNWVKRVTCSRGFLNGMPNPRGYAIHAPTIQFECENFFEEHSEALVDALTLGEVMRPFCWDADICGSDDVEVFDLSPEDDDDDEEKEPNSDL